MLKVSNEKDEALKGMLVLIWLLVDLLLCIRGGAVVWVLLYSILRSNGPHHSLLLRVREADRREETSLYNTQRGCEEWGAGSICSA